MAGCFCPSSLPLEPSVTTKYPCLMFALAVSEQRFSSKSLHRCYSVQSTLLIFLLLWLWAESIDTSDLMISYSLLSLRPSFPPAGASRKRISDPIRPRLCFVCTNNEAFSTRWLRLISFVFFEMCVLISLSFQGFQSRHPFSQQKSFKSLKAFRTFYILQFSKKQSSSFYV